MRPDSCMPPTRDPRPSVPLCDADAVAPLPAEVLAMLHAGRWCSTAVRWTVDAAQVLSSAGSRGASPALDTALDIHDATSALQLVRAAVAALALATDIGFEAAVCHLSQAYFQVAAKVGSMHMFLLCSSTPPGLRRCRRMPGWHRSCLTNFRTRLPAAGARCPVCGALRRRRQRRRRPRQQPPDCQPAGAAGGGGGSGGRA